MDTPDSNTWLLAAKGELGDVVLWEPELEIFEGARGYLSLLEEIGEDAVNWGSLLSGLPRLGVLAEMDFSPLYVERAFDEIDGFLTIEDEPLVDRPGCAFEPIEIYIERTALPELLNEFKQLMERLSAYPPLKPYV